MFRSISDNVNRTADAGPVLMVVSAAAGLVVLLAVINQRLKREARPKTLRHHGKLNREIMKRIPLKAAELRQLKLLAEHGSGSGGEAVSSPLTFLICPSALVKAMKAPPAKIDRRVIAQVVRKITPAAAPGRRR